MNESENIWAKIELKLDRFRNRPFAIKILYKLTVQ